MRSIRQRLLSKWLCQTTYAAVAAGVAVLHVGELDARRALGGVAEIEIVLRQIHRIAVEIVGDAKARCP